MTPRGEFHLLVCYSAVARGFTGDHAFYTVVRWCANSLCANGKTFKGQLFPEKEFEYVEY